MLLGSNKLTLQTGTHLSQGPFNMSNGACDSGISISNGTYIGTGGWHPSFGVTGNGRYTQRGRVGVGGRADAKP